MIPWGWCDQSPQTETERFILYTDAGNNASVDLSFLNDSAVSGNCTVILQDSRLNFSVVQIPVNNSTFYQNELLKIPGVSRIEPDSVRFPETLETAVPYPSNLSDQWAFNRTNLYDTWLLLKSGSVSGSPPITIALIDTGVDPSHAGLTSLINPQGFDWVENSSSMRDTDGHGTFLAGLVNAIVGPENRTGRINLSLLSERVGTNKTGIFASRSAVAIQHAADHGAQIILMGYGGPEQSPAEESAIAYAAKKGCILIAPAGNDASNEGHYPSDYTDVISVGSTAKTDGLSYFSNYGIFVDLVAPGEEVNSIWLGNQTQSATGSSTSAALVTGAVLLMKEVDPALTRDQISQILFSTARDLGRTGRDIYYGYGLLDIGVAVTEAQKQNLNGNHSVKPGQTPENDSPGNGTHTSGNNSVIGGVKRSVALGKDMVEIPLSTGWNFISLPALPGSGKTSGDIFQGINTDGHTIWKYNAVNQEWTAIERQTDLTPLEGFLIYSDRATSLPLVLGNSSGTRELAMSLGWNLVGSPNMTPISARDALSSVSQNWVSLLQYNNTTQSYDPAIIPGANGSHSDSRILSPFSAYWVYMNAAARYHNT